MDCTGQNYYLKVYAYHNLQYELRLSKCLFLHIRGGPFDTWGGGLWFFLWDQTFFFDSQLKRTIFFRPYQKQTIFFSAVKLKTIFFTIYFILFSVHHVKFSRCHHIHLNFSPCFLIRKAIVWNM